MTGGRSPYKKGYRFECVVRRALERYHYKVIRQHGSAFPDLIAVRPTIMMHDPPIPLMLFELGPVLFIECKSAKYLSREEKDGLVALGVYWAEGIVAYPDSHVFDLRKKVIVFAKPDKYQTHVRLEF